ncbi:MAG: MamI family restriction endonuclease [Bacteroidota bacterium]|nr:MamI family restriction endonuclease [Bacteroidota bacterium]
MNKKKVLELLNLHHEAFFDAKPYADETEHPTPSDTRAWSQILVSLLTGVKGLKRNKGADLADGSDVKGANTWDAIDTPRFNGVIKAGTKSKTAGKMEYLDTVKFLFFVLWDNEPINGRERCRIWVVRPTKDKLFRGICEKWYTQLDGKIIKSWNFQLHPPRGKNSNEFRNLCGNLNYPLLFLAEWVGNKYLIKVYDPQILKKDFYTSPIIKK